MLAISAAATAGTVVLSHVEQQKQAARARKAAEIQAAHQRNQADFQTQQALEAQAAQKLQAKIEQTRARGQINNLQNRGNNQISALLMQADREAGSLNSRIDANISRIGAEQRSAYSASIFNTSQAFAANKGPSSGSLAIGLGGAVAGTAGDFFSAIPTDTGPGKPEAK
jgi:hypothetical protein